MLLEGADISKLGPAVVAKLKKFANSGGSYIVKTLICSNKSLKRLNDGTHLSQISDVGLHLWLGPLRSVLLWTVKGRQRSLKLYGCLQEGFLARVALKG